MTIREIVLTLIIACAVGSAAWLLPAAFLLGVLPMDVATLGLVLIVGGAVLAAALILKPKVGT